MNLSLAISDQAPANFFSRPAIGLTDSTSWCWTCCSTFLAVSDLARCALGRANGFCSALRAARVSSGCGCVPTGLASLKPTKLGMSISYPTKMS